MRCKCRHNRRAHQHYRSGSECAWCDCLRFRWRPGVVLLSLAGLFTVMVSILASVTLALAGTSASAQSHPLDCVHWRVHQGSPAGPVVRVLVCSSIPKDQGGDSPARDSTNWANLFVDGDRFVTDGCGRSWTGGAGPCVLEG
jgi:hypothetical protein